MIYLVPGSFRDPNPGFIDISQGVSHWSGTTFILALILLQSAWYIPRVILNRFTKTLSLVLVLGGLHLLLSSHLINNGLDPGECDRHYFILYLVTILCYGLAQMGSIAQSYF